jgi:hypothetical protein
MPEMAPWRAVQEALYRRWTERWVVGDDPRTPFAFDNDKIETGDAAWALVQVRARAGGAGTIGRPGNRKMDRRGAVYIDLREPPGRGVGNLSDLAEAARSIFEDCRLDTYDIRFGPVDIGQEGQIENGRWWGVTVEAPFDYEELK